MGASGEELWRVYDDMAADYLSHATDSVYNALYDRPAVLELLGEVRGLDVLDAACGPGLYAEKLLERGARLQGFDGSIEMVRLAQARVGDRAEIVRARLDERLPYADSCFDRVVCALAIHYLQDPSPAFEEFHRVLRPGGLAVLSTQHPMMNWLRKHGSYLETKLESDEWSSGHHVSWWRWPLTDLCAAATGAGFVIERLVEPRPSEALRDRSQQDFDQLSQIPGFLLLRLAA